jgi:hypothetical protein
VGEIACRADHTARTCETARLQFERQQTVAIVAARHPQFSGLRRSEAEAAVVRRIADQQDDAVAEHAR